MRLALLALLLSLPVYAQSPTRKIAFQCNVEARACVLSMDDWQWMMESMKAKDKEIVRLRAKLGCGPWRED